MLWWLFTLLVLYVYWRTVMSAPDTPKWFYKWLVGVMTVGVCAVIAAGWWARGYIDEKIDPLANSITDVGIKVVEIKGALNSLATKAEVATISDRLTRVEKDIEWLKAGAQHRAHLDQFVATLLLEVAPDELPRLQQGLPLIYAKPQEFLKRFGDLKVVQRHTANFQQLLNLKPPQ